MDCIKIRQLEVFAYHGCMEEEKINGQKFYIDMDLCTDMRKSGVSDELEETVNYAEVCSFVDKYLKEKEKDGQTVYEDERDDNGDLVKMTAGSRI